ncbi:hypothetical protein CNQ34_13680 [Neisseria meningitidis]|uniref:Uncharacterized protein n=1 Tax=Neisseria meningitidis TaxID=487 RepID=A0AB36RMZ5_NEIME|nr:hypothetical protein CNQ34_13680 [Neisseria meningitidis]
MHHVIPTNLHPVIPTKTENQKQKPLCRHSRAGGNLDLRTTAIFKDYLKVRDSRFPLSWNDEF